MIALDISAAFDTVQHEILLHRLREAGVDGAALKWLTDYLTGRKQMVCWRNQMSATSSVSYGVPQGSVLGPLLFNVYMAPLGKLLTELGIPHHIYADDVLIYFILDSSYTDEFYQRVIDSVSSWMIKNYLAINPNKTQGLLFHTGRGRLPTIPQLNVMGEALTIETEGTLKYLGVHLDARLNFSKHVDMVCRSVYAQLFKIRRVRASLNVSTSIMLVNALILSRIDYCSSVLIGTHQKEKDKLQRTLHATARVVFNLDRASSITSSIKKLK